jgi:chromosome segregation ATPase
MKKLIFILCATWLFGGCTSKLKEENRQLGIRLDSMQMIVVENKNLLRLLDEIDQYMDSIDMLRHVVELDLETGISKNDYVFRMKDLTEYVQKAELTIQELSNSNYANISRINQLRKEISVKDEEIANLQGNVLIYQEENKQIKDRMTTAESESLEIKNELEEKTNEFNYAISEYIDKIQTIEAESLFALGAGKEELARHMQFARKRKKQVLHDALDYYNSSNKLGYEPALDRIKYLKEKLKIN